MVFHFTIQGNGTVAPMVLYLQQCANLKETHLLYKGKPLSSEGKPTTLLQTLGILRE